MHSRRPFIHPPTAKRQSLHSAVEILQLPFPVYLHTPNDTGDRVNDLIAVNYVPEPIKLPFQMSGINVTVEIPKEIGTFIPGYFGSFKKNESKKCNTVHDRNTPRFHHESNVVHLLLEEAFFLSHTIGCGLILFEQCPVEPNDLWEKFKGIRPDFVSKYIAYHHFRSKGWVVRSCTKYGVDYALYKKGPPFYHATFGVQIVSKTLSPVNNNVEFFLASFRTMDIVKKNLLICRVENDENVTLPKMVNSKISEYLFSRWTPSKGKNCNVVSNVH